MDRKRYAVNNITLQFLEQAKRYRNGNNFFFTQLRFERRFLPFQTVDTPQPMYYGHYREYSNMSKMNASQVGKK